MSELKTLIIIGAGGHGKVVADCAINMGVYCTIKFLDSNFPDYNKVAGWDIVGSPDMYEDFDEEDAEYFIAIGDNKVREAWQTKLTASNKKIATLIHPQASLGIDVKIAVGSLVLAGAVINILTKIGQGCIVNTGATVDHDCKIGAFCHMAPGVNLAGGVKLGAKVFFGIGSAAIPGISVGENSIIGAGSTVLNDIPENSVCVGTPAKVIKPNAS